jgi:hypothetical protein
MDYDDILNVLAPCGLNCSKCLAYKDGDIKRSAGELKRLLGEFDSYVETFSQISPVFKNYPSFKKLLDHFAQASCEGCRNGSCVYPNCVVASCCKGKGVDFCFQCTEYPCDKTNFDPALKEILLKINNLMKEKGIERYLEESKDLPRYT